MYNVWCSQHSKTKTSDSVELFQLMRSDFEAVMERFPILKTRLAQIGQARVRRASAEPDFGIRAAGSRKQDTSPEPERSSEVCGSESAREKMRVYVCVCVLVCMCVRVSLDIQYTVKDFLHFVCVRARIYACVCVQSPTRSSKSPERTSASGAAGDKKSKGKSKACHQQ